MGILLILSIGLKKALLRSLNWKTALTGLTVFGTILASDLISEFWPVLILVLGVLIIVMPELGRLRYTMQRSHSPMVQVGRNTRTRHDYYGPDIDWPDDVYDD